MRRVGVGQVGHPRWIGVGVSIGWVALSPTRAHAIDAYEIQVYDGTAHAPGVPGAELHVNTVPKGRRTSDPPELPSHAQSHFTLEPSLGVTAWWEVGGYL